MHIDHFMAEIAGWAGVGFYILSYFLLSTGKLSANDRLFHGMNALGAIGLIIDSISKDDKPSMVVNIVWLAIALAMIIKNLRSNGSR